MIIETRRGTGGAALLVASSPCSRNVKRRPTTSGRRSEQRRAALDRAKRSCSSRPGSPPSRRRKSDGRSRPTIALPDEVAVINIGLALFADAVRDQSTAVEQVDWRIPADGQPDLHDGPECLYGQRSMDLDVANAGGRASAGRICPLLVDVASSGKVVPGMSDRMLLHCGPAIEWSDGLRPVTPLDALPLRSRKAGQKTVDEADRMLADGTVSWSPATDTTRSAHGECHRPVGAGLRRRQLRRWHQGIRADQPGPRGDRLVRS